MPNERIYLIDDPALGVKAETRQDVIDRHIGRYWRAIQLADRTGGYWLDFACGSGYGTRIIADMAIADVALGVDVDAEAIEYARRNYETSNCVFDDRLRKNGFHVVVSIETLEHLSPLAQYTFLDLCHQALKPEGTFILACPLGNGPNPNNPFHLNEPTEAELTGWLLDRFAFVRVEVETYLSTSGPAVQAWATCREPK